MKKFIVLPFVFYFLLQINSLSYGQDDRWVDICASDKNIWFLDKTTVQCNDGVYIVWVKQVCISDCAYYQLVRHQLNANWRKVGILSVARYYDNGNRKNSSPSSPDIWEDIIPDSMAECALNYLLNQYPCE